MFTYSNQIQEFSLIVRDGIHLFKRSFSAVWLWLLFFIAPLVILAFLRPTLFVGNFESLTLQIVSFSAGSIFLLFGIVFITNLIDSAATNSAYDVRASFGVALRKLPLAVAGVVLLLIAGSALEMVAFLVGLFNPMSPSAMSSLALLVLGQIVMVIIIYNVLALVLFLMILAADKLPFTQAVQHAYQFLWGQWWRTVGVIFFGFLACLAVIVPSLIIMASFPVTKIVLTLFITEFCMLFAICLLLVQLNDLKMRHAAKIVYRLIKQNSPA